jgi:preprotein translocase subunit Sec61beta
VKQQAASARNGRYRSMLIVAAGLISIFSPSSLGGVIEPKLMLLLCAFASVVLMLTFERGRWIVPNAIAGLAVLALFALFTATSPLPDLAVGGLLPYVLLLTVLLVDVRHVDHTVWATRALLVVNAFVLFLGFGTVAGNELALHLIESYYKEFGEELFESMILWYSKPVSVFASHSIAALAYFALLCLNLRVAKSKEGVASTRALYRVSAFGYLVLIPLLTSNTAFALFVPALGLFVSHFLSSLKPVHRACALAVILLVAMIGAATAIGSDDLQAVSTSLVAIVSNEGGGFLGRYSYGTRLQGTYDYLAAHNFLPIGITYSTSVALGDNLIAEYILKISVVGYALILIMLWVWLRHNLPDRSSRILFFLFFLIADLGYPLLTYHRVAGFLPLFALLWSMSADSRASRSVVAH